MNDNAPVSAGDQALLDRRTAEGCKPEWCLHINGKNYGLPRADVHEDATGTHALEPRDRRPHLVAAWIADEVWNPAAQVLRAPGLEPLSPNSAGEQYLANLRALEINAAEAWKGTERPQIEPLRIYSGPAPDYDEYWPEANGRAAWWVLYRYGSHYVLIARPPRPRDEGR